PVAPFAGLPVRHGQAVGGDAAEVPVGQVVPVGVVVWPTDLADGTVRPGGLQPGAEVGEVLLDACVQGRGQVTGGVSVAFGLPDGGLEGPSVSTAAVGVPVVVCTEIGRAHV